MAQIVVCYNFSITWRGVRLFSNTYDGMHIIKYSEGFFFSIHYKNEKKKLLSIGKQNRQALHQTKFFSFKSKVLKYRFVALSCDISNGIHVLLRKHILVKLSYIKIFPGKLCWTKLQKIKQTNEKSGNH